MKMFSKYIIMVILLFIIVVAFIFLDIKVYADLKEKVNYYALSKYMNENPSLDNDSENPKNEITNEKSERILKLESLHSENEDVVAWIDISGTNISYPVLLADNNSYYLNHNYKKEYSDKGSLFLDKNTSLEPRCDNFLIYGHRNKGGAMFEDLLKYEDESFFNEHKTIHFTTLTEDAEYEIISAFRSKVYYKSDKNVFRYYYFIDAQNENDFNEFVQNAKSASLYETNVSASYGDSLLTLSTCAYHTEDGRFAVVAKKKV